MILDKTSSLSFTRFSLLDEHDLPKPHIHETILNSKKFYNHPGDSHWMGKFGANILEFGNGVFNSAKKKILNTTNPKVSEEFYFDHKNLENTNLNHCLKTYWIGHATFLFTYVNNGTETTILLDPSYAEKITGLGLSIYENVGKRAIPLEQLPKIDIVLITHNHTDHLDPNTLDFIYKRDEPIVFCPDKMGTRLKKEFKPKAEDFTWWDSAIFSNGIKITCTPAHHTSQTEKVPCQEEHWCSWILQVPYEEKETLTVYATGDTACHVNLNTKGSQKIHQEANLKFFNSISVFFPKIDLCLIPVDPYEGEESVHANFGQLVDLMNIVKPEYSIAMHWGIWGFSKETKTGDFKGFVEKVNKNVVEKYQHGEILVLRIGEQKIMYRKEGKTHLV